MVQTLDLGGTSIKADINMSKDVKENMVLLSEQRVNLR